MADVLGMDLEQPARGAAPGINEYAYWLKQIRAAQKREKTYRTEARRYIALYEAEKKRENSFNILYSNTETLQPALYNELPRAVVQRRFKDEDQLAGLASRAMERTLEYIIDTPDQGYESFHSLMENSVLSSLVPGRGLAQFRYDADLTETGQEGAGKQVAIEAEGQTDDSGDLDGESAEQAEDVQGLEAEVKYEGVCGNVVQWDRVLFGYARRWVNVPWVAFEHRMTKQDVSASFGAAWVEKINFGPAKDESSEEDRRTEEDKNRAEQVAVVWEIWHKSAKKVLFFAETYQDGVVKRLDDPLGLSGFYNIPEPLQLFTRVSGMVPVPLYALYEEQAKELNRITMRINKIVEALKVRGFYDKNVGDLSTLLTKEDNTLIAASGIGAFKDGQTVDQSIWLMPLDKLIVVLQQLYAQRQQIKQVIYEVTGISDILRGSSVASETATAQNIKNQWGTLRLKKMQKRVQRYVRDCLRICSEIAAKHFSEQTFAQQTGLKIQTSEEKQQATVALQQAQQQAMMQQAQQPQVPQQGVMDPAAAGAGAGLSTPQPPQPDPAQQQQQAQMQQLQQQVQAPSWGEVIKLLQDNLQRNYKIDIETNSTVDPEAVEDKTAVGEMMQALSQVMSQLMPAAQQGVMPMAAVKAILMSITRRFRFGPEVEDSLAMMPDQMPQQGPDPKQLEQQQKKIEQQGAQLKEQEAKIQQDAAALDQKKKELAMQQQMAEEQIKMKEQISLAKIDLAEQKAQMKLEQQEASMLAKVDSKRMADEAAVQQHLMQGEHANSQKDMQRRVAHEGNVARFKGEQQGVQQGEKQGQQPMQDVSQAIMAALQQMQAPKPSTKRRLRVAKNAQGVYEGEVEG